MSSTILRSATRFALVASLLACGGPSTRPAPVDNGGSGGDEGQAGSGGDGGAGGGGTGGRGGSTPDQRDAAPGGGGGAGGMGGSTNDAATDDTPDLARADAQTTADVAPPADGAKPPGGKFVIESLDGEVTVGEVDAFLAAVSTMTIPVSQFPNGSHNNLADGNGGTTLEGINRMYEVTGDVPAFAAQHRKLLDVAIRWNDAWLIHRNDLAMGEKRVMWTGQVDPVWPPDALPSTYAGCEVGETVGILAYTALNIFKTKDIAGETVPDGDPNGYGKTYLARAKTYLSMLEVSMDKFFNVYFLDKPTLTIKHPDAPAYNAIPSNNVNAWNRSMMFLHAWQTLGEIHALLGDNAAKATMYKAITKNTVDLFVQNAVPTMAPDGTPVYDWGYGNFGDVKNNKSGEQIGVHAQYDIWGLTRAWRAGYTSATAAQMKTYADTVVHELTLPDGTYAGHINRCCDTQTYNYLPSGFMFLVPFNHDIFKHAAMMDVMSGRQQTRAELTSGILWAKHVLAH